MSLPPNQPGEPSRRVRFRRRWLWLTGLVLLLAAAALASILASRRTHEPALRERYERIELGMTRNEAEMTLGTPFGQRDNQEVWNDNLESCHVVLTFTLDGRVQDKK